MVLLLLVEDLKNEVTPVIIRHFYPNSGVKICNNLDDTVRLVQNDVKPIIIRQ